LDACRHCREAERLGSKKLTTVRERIRQLRRIKHALAELVTGWHGNRDKMRCPLINALEHQH